MNKSITVVEAEQKLHALEKDLCSRIEQFEQETSLIVNNIYVNRHKGAFVPEGKHNVLYSIECEVHLV